MALAIALGLFANADVLIIPSRWEGFGLIAAEVMRSGMAVIATRVGGSPEVVVDGETGLLIEPNNADAIVRAVESLDHSTLKRMGKAGHQRFGQLFTTRWIVFTANFAKFMASMRQPITGRSYVKAGKR